MNLIEFKDLPSTETPINSSNLNLLQDNVEDAIGEVNKINDANLLMSSSDVIPITPTTGSNYGNYGNSYYYKKGTKVHVHLGLSGLTPNASSVVFTLPEGYRPKDIPPIIGLGQGVNEIIGGQVQGYGEIMIYPTSQYALFDFEFDAFN